MKNIIKGFLLSVAAITLFAGCAQENFSAPEGKSMIFTATIADATRTSIDANGTVGKVNWVAGDEITINGVVYVATPDASDATKATFEKKNASDADAQDIYGEYYATYCCTFDPETGEGTIPETQAYTSAGMLSAPMIARSESTSLSFLNICGVLEITLKGTETIGSIAVSSENAGMSGKFTILGEQTATITDTDNKSVTLDCGDGIALTSDGSKFYVAVPAGEYTGLNISALTTDGKNWSKTAVNTASVESNKIYALEFTPEFIAGVARYSNNGGTIWTNVASLKEAVEGATGTSAQHAKVELLKDAAHGSDAAIDLSGKYIDIDGNGYTYDVSTRPSASAGAFSANAVFTATGGKDAKEGSVIFTDITFDGKSTDNAAINSRLLYNQSGMEFTFGTGTVIKDITFQAYGQNTNAGGVLYNEFGVINIDGATVNNCCAKAYSGSYLAGGFIDNCGGTINVKSGSITGCSALATTTEETRGGFAYVTQISSTAGALNISGGTVSESKAKNGAVAYVSSNSKVNITGGTISGCEASGNGGVFYNNNKNNTITISGGTIDNCSAVNGGAVYLAATSAKVTLSGNALIKDCEASTAGGGIGTGASAVVEMKGSARITGCKALDGNGGAIRDNYTAGSVTVTENAVIDKCSATSQGGAIQHCGIITISGNATIDDCHSDKTGGAIAVWQKATLEGNATIKGCSSDLGGAICDSTKTDKYGVVIIQGSAKIDGCTASRGGGVYMASGAVGGSCTIAETATISNCTTTSYGGAIYHSKGTVTISGGTITGCTASRGGGIYNTSKGTVITISGGLIEKCTGSYGGAVCVNNGIFTQEGGTIDQEGSYSAVSTANYTNDITINVNGGTIKSALGRAISLAVSTATLNITGGNIISEATDKETNTAVYNYRSKVNISGNPKISSYYHGVYSLAGTVDITGGDISSTNGFGINILNSGTNVINFSISGGKVTSPSGNAAINFPETPQSGSTLAITGGLYSSVSDAMKAYLGSEYQFADNGDGYFKVAPLK